jgi:hypothetical protein
MMIDDEDDEKNVMQRCGKRSIHGILIRNPFIRRHLED